MEEAQIILERNEQQLKTLGRHEEKIEVMEGQPRMRIQQINTAIIAALADGLISAVIGMLHYTQIAYQLQC